MKTAATKYSWIKETDLRLGADYHLSDGPKTKRILEKSPFTKIPLNKAAIDIFLGSRFKRVFVEDSKKGYPYLTGSDMIKVDLDSGKYLSEKYTGQQEILMIDKGYILVSCSGTLGNTVFTNDDFVGRIGTHDLIRIIPNEEVIRPGFLHAYLSSKYGYSLLTQVSYGGVVKHIEPHHIADLPVPLFPSDQQQYIHELIVQAAELRVAGNSLLREARLLFETKLPDFILDNYYSISRKVICRNSNKIKASNRLLAFENFYTTLRKSYSVISIGKIAKTVYTPNIFKRVRVENRLSGIPFFSGSDLLQANPRRGSFLSRKMKNLKDYILADGMITIQDSGTIGYVVQVDKRFENCAATNNLIRVVPFDNNRDLGYVYVFLTSKQGQSILKSLTYGSVQQHIDHHQIKDLEIPIIDDIKEDVIQNAANAKHNFSTAYELETQAITLIETEIASWQS